MTENTHGRILIGGKRVGFQGDMPGLLEEALLTVEQGQPIYLAGGFGGITLDIAIALGVDDGRWFPALPNAPAADERIVNGMTRLTEATKVTGGKSLDNGLTQAETQRLAVCHRPSEIAALVSLGLGRRVAAVRSNG
jgi:hypothetical protein